ncbi:MAG: AAA family ATPase [Magnetococcales bacterium]|nr:AAA family ATPase [Magnetococcales bacterium]NGZ27917.1 AAA family ATPase [Magnetococcales bacterium]
MTNHSTNPVIVKLRRLEITNFKAINHFVMDFPQPNMADEPDIFAMGSQNGVGKTSILEAISVLIWGIFSSVKEMELKSDHPPPLSELLVRAGAEFALIQSLLFVNNKIYEYSIKVLLSGSIIINNDNMKECFPSEIIPLLRSLKKFFSSFLGYDTEPVILPYCLYFHSYRKVAEGNLEMGMLINGSKATEASKISVFKQTVLYALMNQANLFDVPDQSLSANVVDKLNSLIHFYADGKIDKLRPYADNTLEFRISPTHGGPSYSFDGLSSGQKEIISTLFLIWYYTHDQPRIVLIDEPELHLNLEWHRHFVQQLVKLVPENQYILATHSEDVFDSVDQDRRILLQRDQPSS